jgi:hypothetical protein
MPDDEGGSGTGNWFSGQVNAELLTMGMALTSGALRAVGLVLASAAIGVLLVVGECASTAAKWETGKSSGRVLCPVIVSVAPALVVPLWCI